MWVRGLKQSVGINLRQQVVAPYVGAWIETASGDSGRGGGWSHPMWVRGLKQDELQDKRLRLGRTLCGCVD